MAQIPIYEDDGPSQPADIRPTRLGPEQQVPKGLEEASRAAGQFSEVVRGMVRQQNANQWNDLHASYATHLQNLTEQFAGTPLHNSTDYDNYLSQLRTATDPATFTKGLNGVVSSKVLNHAADNFKVMQAEFMTTHQMQAMTTLHKNFQGDAETNIDSYAQLMGRSGPQQYPLYKQMGLDAIKGDAANGIFTDAESEQRTKTFLNKADLYGASMYTDQHPGPAGLLFSNPQATAKQYPNLSDDQRKSMLDGSYRTLTRESDTADVRLKQQVNANENKVLDMLSGKLPMDKGWVAEQQKDRMLDDKYYGMVFHAPPPLSDNPAGVNNYITQLNNPNLNKDAANAILLNASRDTSLSQENRRTVQDAVSAVSAGMGSDLANARGLATIPYNAGLAAFKKAHGLDDPMNGNTMMMGPQIKAALVRDRQDWEAQIMHNTNHPADVNTITSGWDHSKYFDFLNAPTSTASKPAASGGSSSPAPAASTPPKADPYPGRMGVPVPPAIHGALSGELIPGA